MSVTIKLSHGEVDKARACGEERHEASWGRHENKNGNSKETEFDARWKHINGAGGECAVGKATGKIWHASVNTFKEGADVGERIQVRWRSRENYDLIVRDDDRDSDFFFLVTGGPVTYRIHGWLKGREAKQERFKAAYGGYRESYFVPISELNPYFLEKAEPPPPDWPTAGWPEECIESQRKFHGHRAARLYPLLKKKVKTPAGEATLMQVLGDDVGVHIEGEKQMRHYTLWEIKP